MDFGLDNIRELIEGFLKNSGGRRGREREQRRQERAAAAGPAEASAAGGGTADGADGAAEGAAGGTSLDAGLDADAGGAEADGAGAQTRTKLSEDRPDPDDLDDDEAVDELFHRLETLEDELERKDAKLGTIRDSQEHVSDQVEEVNDTVRQLLGIYDQLTNDVNPFTGDGEEEGGFDVFGDGDEEGFGIDAEATAGRGVEEETVSFDDLKTAIEDAAEEAADEGEPITFDETEGNESDDEDDTTVEVQATESVDAADEDTDDDGEDEDVTLDSLANTYASDLIVFEWLTDLVRTAGPSATLRAISYYHEIGWIETEVKEHLEAVLSGPDLDIHVDPGQTPEELTAEDHADSYTYIMKLQEVHETKGEVGPAAK